MKHLLLTFLYTLGNEAEFDLLKQKNKMFPSKYEVTKGAFKLATITVKLLVMKIKM